VRLVKKGEILFIDTGWDQRIELDVVMAHEQKLSELHRLGIQELAEISQECGLYPMEK